MEATVFNPIQLHLLQMFARMNSEEELKHYQFPQVDVRTLAEL